MMALNYKLFGGFSMLAVRFFNAFLSAALVMASYGLFRTVYGKKAGLFGAFAAAVMPLFFMIYRFGIDAYPLLAFFVISIMCLCVAIKSGRMRHFALAGLCFGLTLYTYALSYLTIPLFLLLALLALVRCKAVCFKQAAACAAPVFILALPLVVELLVNNGVLPEIKSFISFAKLPAYAGSEISFASIPQTLSQCYRLFLCDSLPHSAVAPYYTLYLMSVPLAATGFIINVIGSARALKSRAFNYSLIAISAFAASFLSGLLVSGFNIMRMIAVFAPLLWFVVTGARFVWARLADAFAAVLALYCALACSFFSYYFTRYNAENAPIPYFDSGATEIYRDIRGQYPDNELYFLVYPAGTTYVDSYIYALLGSLQSPYDFNSARVDNESGFSSGLDNFYAPVRDFGTGELVYEIYDDCAYVIYQPGLSETMQSVVARLDESSLVREVQYPYLIYTPDGLNP